jgi:hypothetical protein
MNCGDNRRIIMETIILGGLVGLICVIAYKVIDNLNDRLKLVEDVIEYNVNILKDNYKIHEHLKRGFELDTLGKYGTTGRFNR